MPEEKREADAKKRAFGMREVGEIAMGASLLILPMALTEEVWNLGESLPLSNTLLMLFSAYAIIGFFVYHRVYEGELKSHLPEFLLRVGSVYLITLVVAGLCLQSVDRFPLLSDPIVALKRAILCSVPGSFFATVLSSIR